VGLTYQNQPSITFGCIQKTCGREEIAYAVFIYYLIASFVKPSECLYMYLLSGS
jgi:hypothetical protein